ncbi:chorismate mutase, partial [Candidatus Pelagibacter sp.]|nr:chorismate mutase [Candidatus Pelagibacter sp.]
MSPENKKKLEKIRVKLDKLDNKLLALIKNRTSLVKEVLKLKEFKKEIVDQ